MRSLTANELVRLRGNVRRWQERPITNQPLLDVVDVLMSTGARIGEVLALRWEDVDFAKNTVHISATQVFIKGEGIVYQPISKGSKDLLYPWVC
ncbi:tyrosine-type recombinase/integrase [Corynebacterium belfantii]|uniref:tyrosine-type recombinase/integrase n=1 Tax=Corynebacterium belfantii TaxID=2014537 RepID=UPI0035A8DA4A